VDIIAAARLRKSQFVVAGYHKWGTVVAFLPFTGRILLIMKPLESFTLDELDIVLCIVGTEFYRTLSTGPLYCSLWR
jgi:hypothetical protein